MYGFYSNPEVVTTYHAASMNMGAYKVADIWLLNKLGLSVQYYDGDNNQVYNNSIKPNLKILNEGTQTFNLSDLTIKYWYTIDGEIPQEFHVDWAQAGNNNVTGSFASVFPVLTADYSLTIGFNSISGILGPNQSTELRTRFNKTDWSNYNETDDFSYANLGGYTNVPKIGLYYNGNLIWGVTP